MTIPERVARHEYKSEHLEATRQALQTFAKLERKNCLAYEFVALKLGCSPSQASKLVIEVYRQMRSAAL